MIFLTNKVRAFTFLCWMIKDLTWNVTCYPLTWAIMIFCLIGEILVGCWGMGFPETLRFLQWATCMWLSGNALWMFTDTMYGKTPACFRDIGFRWVPSIAADEQYHRDGIRVAQWLVLASLALAFVPYVFLVPDIWREVRRDALLEGDKTRKIGEEARRRRVLLQAHASSFMIFWIAKDVWWMVHMLWPAVLCTVLVVCFMLDATYRLHGTVLDPETMAIMLWVAGNFTWMISMEAFDDQVLALRVVAACFLLAGIPVAVCAFYLREEGDLFSDTTPLLGGVGPARRF